MKDDRTNKTGCFLGPLHDIRPPMWVGVKGHLWNSYDRRVLTPRVYGLGYSVNFHEVARRLKLMR